MKEKVMTFTIKVSMFVLVFLVAVGISWSITYGVLELFGVAFPEIYENSPLRTTAIWLLISLFNLHRNSKLSV